MAHTSAAFGPNPLPRVCSVAHQGLSGPPVVTRKRVRHVTVLAERANFGAAAMSRCAEYHVDQCT
jgi:hypothetical protein